MTSEKLHNMPSVMTMGGIASGKTEALRTIVEAGLELFILKTEPSENLDDMPSDKVHWQYIPPATVPLSVMIKNAKLINMLTYKALSNLEEMDRSLYTQYIQVLEACNNFKDDRTGKSYGDVTSWDHSRCFVIDALSGLSQMALDMIVGGKPVKGKEQYGVAMSNLEDFINYLTTNTKCMFILNAHLEMEPTFEGGSTALMAATLGQKLAPKLPKYFSDIIHARRTGTTWTWSTLTPNAELKARNVPWLQDMPQSYVPLIKTWRDRHAKGLVVEQTPKTPVLGV
jgi:hypothetical protein